MKGAKGGNRDRIISWLFSEKNRKKREEELEEEQLEEEKIDEKRKERRKNKKKDVSIQDNNEISVEETLEEINEEIKLQDDNKESITPISTDGTKVETSEDKDKSKPDKKPVQDIDVLELDEEIDDDLDVTLIDIFDTSRDKDKGKDKKPPIVSLDVEVVEELKEQHRERVEEAEEINTQRLFPVVEEVDLSNKDNVDTLEKPELLQISIIEEIDNLLRNDAYDLRDIKYRIEVLNQQEKDEVLLENIEKIQKELEDLIRRFDEIKKKYEYAYSNISIKDIDMINDLNLGFSISDYIVNGKEGLDNSTTLDQIHEIEEFIDIINNIIEIEKQKDMVQESVDNKLIDYSIRDEEFDKLQDQYANVEGINAALDKYNLDIDAMLKTLNEKIANSEEITRRIEVTTEIVPDLNRIMQATILLASSKMVPPTPAGNLFRATLFISAAHMLATAFTPRTEEREIVRTTVTDYSKDILNSKDSIKDVLGNIEDAFSKISYMKDTFEKEFSEFKNQIPEYDELIKNIFSIEKELTRQQTIAYDYSNRFDQALAINNEKVKKLEYEND